MGIAQQLAATGYEATYLRQQDRLKRLRALARIGQTETATCEIAEPATVERAQRAGGELMNDLATISGALDCMGQGASRAQILTFQELMKAEFGPHSEEDFPVVDIFAPGLYARQITLPKGCVVVGKIHRHAHINTISRGRVWVVTEFGRDELAAPVSFVSQPGTKRVVVAQEETIWTTYHPTNETDLAKIEESVIAPTYEALETELLS